ncbi:MAG: four helix bundle protein [Anditalea sp.]
MHNFKELKVWQKSVDFAVLIYQLTSKFPSEEKYGLTSQMRRAGVSIPSNIAEGCAKSSQRSFSNALEISLGESFELETQQEISKRNGLIAEHQINDMNSSLTEIHKNDHGSKIHSTIVYV